MAQIESGTYTVVGNLGGHRTIKFSDDVSWMSRPPSAGTRIVYGMTGPDNENSFTGFGFLSPDGVLSVWGSKAHAGLDTHIAAARWLVKNGVGKEVELGRAYAFKATRCYKCNRKLTTEHAKVHGYGSDCAAQHGLPYDRKARLTDGHPLYQDVAA